LLSGEGIGGIVGRASTMLGLALKILLCGQARGLARLVIGAFVNAPRAGPVPP
jgi:hypothetical protein